MPKSRHIMHCETRQKININAAFGKMTPSRSYYPTGPAYPTSDSPGTPWRPLHIVSGLVVAFALSFIFTMMILSATGC